MFYDKKIELYKEGQPIKNKYGGTAIGKPVYIKTINCDVQAYSRELFKKEYGYDIDVSERVFMDLDAEAIEGRIIKYNNNDYEIKKTIEWDDYMELMIYGL